jgi:hypothetical protein
LSDATFLHTVVQPVEEEGGSSQPVHPTEPAEGCADPDFSEADRASEQ